MGREDSGTQAMSIADSSGFDFARPVFALPGFVERWLPRLGSVIHVLGYCLAMLVLIAHGLQPIVAFVLALAVHFGSVVLHELGHLLAARLVGAHVITVRLSWLTLLRQRSGWRMRWQRPMRGTAGSVTAVAPDGPTQRRKMALIVAGGPLATLLLCLAGHVLSRQTSLQALGDALLWINGALLLFNLLPFMRPVASDGRLLLAFLLRKRVSLEGELYLHMLAQGFAGRRFGHIDDREIDTLMSGPMPVPLLACYFRIVRALDRGQPEDGLAVWEEFAPRIEALPAVQRQDLEPMLALTRAEAAFAQAEAAGVAQPLVDIELPQDLVWAVPYLVQRRSAMLAALRGDVAATRSAIQAASASSEESIDVATRQYERALQHRIGERLQRNV